MSPGETVRNFISALERKDFDAACALITDDCEYDNVPFAKVFGPTGLRSVLEPFLGGCAGVEWVIHHQVESGNVVMNERTDRFELAGRWAELPVAGVFELRDGKICLWRDYFDQAQFTKAVSG
jgi:limonene-1,2-epoxide hydrolase